MHTIVRPTRNTEMYYKINNLDMVYDYRAELLASGNLEWPQQREAVLGRSHNYNLLKALNQNKERRKALNEQIIVLRRRTAAYAVIRENFEMVITALCHSSRSCMWGRLLI